MRLTYQFLVPLFFSVAVASACGVDATNVPSDADLSDADPALIPDSAGTVLPLENYEVSGPVIDYFAAPGTTVTGATVVTEGVRPPIEATIDGDGRYSMEVLANSLFYLSSEAPGYVLSRSGALQMLASPIVRDQYIASAQGVARQYAAVGVTQQANAGLVMVELRDRDGLPIVGLPASALKLSTIDNPGVSISTPFFVAEGGADLSPSATTPVSALDNYELPDQPDEVDLRRARAAFLNVPAGEYNVTVDLPNDGGTQTIFLIVPEGGVSFLTSNINGDGRGDPNIVLDPNSPLGFTEDIYPILQTVARGGDGCATCHNAELFLSYLGSPEATLQLLMEDALDPAGVPRVNLSDPEASPLLQNPVYEDLPNHPNVFWTINSNHYKGIVAWIQQGAALHREDAVLP